MNVRSWPLAIVRPGEMFTFAGSNLRFKCLSDTRDVIKIESVDSGITKSIDIEAAYSYRVNMVTIKSLTRLVYLVD